MVYRKKTAIMVCFLMAVCLCLLACGGEKKEGKVIVTESEFSVRRDGEKAFVIDARGKVRNVGDVDVKNVLVTGYCRSCIEMIKPGHWFISGAEKTEAQKDLLSYITVGAEEEFSFEEVAFIYNMVDEAPESMPEEMEVVVKSFEVVE